MVVQRLGNGDLAEIQLLLRLTDCHVAEIEAHRGENTWHWLIKVRTINCCFERSDAIW